MLRRPPHPACSRRTSHHPHYWRALAYSSPTIQVNNAIETSKWLMSCHSLTFAPPPLFCSNWWIFLGKHHNCNFFRPLIRRQRKNLPFTSFETNEVRPQKNKPSPPAPSAFSFFENNEIKSSSPSGRQSGISHLLINISIITVVNITVITVTNPIINISSITLTTTNTIINFTAVTITIPIINIFSITIIMMFFRVWNIKSRLTVSNSGRNRCWLRPIPLDSDDFYHVSYSYLMCTRHSSACQKYFQNAP